MANEERVKTGNKRCFDVAFLSGSDEKKICNSKEEAKKVSLLEKNLRIDKEEVRLDFSCSKIFFLIRFENELAEGPGEI